MRRRALFAVSIVAALVACRREFAPLNAVQKMAYAVKPAVVRITAIATAEFRYDASALDAVEILAGVHAPGREALNAAAGALSVATGAGGSGSGFIVHPDGYVLTNGHVIASVGDSAKLDAELRRNGAIAALVRHFPIEALRVLYRDNRLDRCIEVMARRGTVENVKIEKAVELSNGERLPFEVRKYSPPLEDLGSDLALLRVSRRNLPVLRLGSSEAVGVGESIWSVGYPAVASSSDEVIGGWLSADSDLEATFNPGTITAIRKNVANAPVFQSNVAIYRGNSGGPAVDLRGEVIGVATWGHSDAEQIKFLVPIDVARRILAEEGVALNVDGEFGRAYRPALDSAAAGEWEAARRNLAQASRLFPNSPDLIRFGSDAQRALRSAPIWRFDAVLAGAAGTAGLVAGAAVLAAVRLRRRPRIHPAPAPLRHRRSPARAAADGALGRLTILNGERAGEKIALGGSGIRIGREPAICEIVLDNPKVSRLHAEVVAMDGDVLLIDRGSSNGTFVNDQKIDRQALADGDVIYFGGRAAVAVVFHV